MCPVTRDDAGGVITTRRRGVGVIHPSRASMPARLHVEGDGSRLCQHPERDGPRIIVHCRLQQLRLEMITRSTGLVCAAEDEPFAIGGRLTAPDANPLLPPAVRREAAR